MLGKICSCFEQEESYILVDEETTSNAGTYIEKDIYGRAKGTPYMMVQQEMIAALDRMEKEPLPKRRRRDRVSPTTPPRQPSPRRRFFRKRNWVCPIEIMKPIDAVTGKVIGFLERVYYWDWVKDPIFDSVV